MYRRTHAARGTLTCTELQAVALSFDKCDSSGEDHADLAVRIRLAAKTSRAGPSMASEDRAVDALKAPPILNLDKPFRTY